MKKIQSKKVKVTVDKRKKSIAIKKDQKKRKVIKKLAKPISSDDSTSDNATLDNVDTSEPEDEIPHRRVPYSAVYSDSSDNDADVVNLENGEKVKEGNWVVINFAGKPYPGKVMEVQSGNSDGRNLKVKCLQEATREIEGSYWKWPEEEDLDWYGITDCRYKVADPVVQRNVRGLIFRVTELES